MNQNFTKILLSGIVMLFFTTIAFSQIPNDSPYPVDFVITDAAGNESTFEYASYVDFGITLSQTVSGELEWARDNGLYDSDGDGVDDPDYTDSLNCSWGTTMPMAGKMALIRRGACFFSQKILNAQNAGAVGAIICNHTPGDGLVNMLGIDSAELVTIPGIFITYEDCELIRAGIDSGESTTATFRVNTFYGQLGPYAYGTPVEHILPLDEIQVNVLNTDTLNAITDTDVTVTITDPTGTVTTLTETVETIAPIEDRIVQFGDYLPEAIGTYSMAFSNSLSTDVLETTFKITEDTWHMDNENITETIEPSDQGFIDDGLRYDFGSTYLAGPVEGIATAATFMLGNASEIYTGDEDSDLFQIRLYDMDPDGDGMIDENATDYSSFQVVGFADYSLTGNEVAFEPILVEFDDPAVLKANGQYALMVQYDGVNAGLGIPPKYAFGGTEDYPYYGTFVYTDQLYLGGWAGGWRGVIRLHTSVISSIESVNALAANKINVFPNPTSNVINLAFDLDANADEVSVRITDVMGRLVSTKILNNVLNETIEFNNSHLANGTYIMSVVTPEGFRAVKFMVAK